MNRNCVKPAFYRASAWQKIVLTVASKCQRDDVKGQSQPIIIKRISVKCKTNYKSSSTSADPACETCRSATQTTNKTGSQTQNEGAVVESFLPLPAGFLQLARAERHGHYTRRWEERIGRCVSKDAIPRFQ
jgi:hypothetical protein